MAVKNAFLVSFASLFVHLKPFGSRRAKYLMTNLTENMLRKLLKNLKLICYAASTAVIVRRSAPRKPSFFSRIIPLLDILGRK